MASAKFQLSANGGLSWLPADVPLASGNGLAQAGGNASVYARLASTAGVDTVAWSIVAASENAPLLTLTQYPDKSIQTLVPLDSAATWLLRAVVNGGIDPLTRAPSRDLASALAIKVLTDGGMELLAPGEGDEGDRAFGWTTAFNALASAGIGAGTATRVRADASPYLSGDVTFAGGANVTLGQVGSTITINASGGGGGALPSPYTATLATVDGKANSLFITAPTVNGADAPHIRIKGVGAHEVSPDDLFGGHVIIEGGDSDTTDGGTPGEAVLRGGSNLAVGGSSGGAATVVGGTGNFVGGPALMRGGTPVDTNGNGGYVQIEGGAVAGTGDGGSALVLGGSSDAGTGGDALLRGGAGLTAGTAGLLGGQPFDVNGTGGAVAVTGASGNGSGSGGGAQVSGGAGGTTGNGGALTLAGGASTGGTGKVGGSVDVAGGEATGTTGAGGSATLRGADGTGQGGGLSCYAGGGPIAGTASFRAGNATGSGAGGATSVSGGTGGSTGNGGSASFVGGAAGTGGSAKAGGNAFVTGGASLGTTGAGGHAIVGGGQGIASGGECRMEGGSATTTGGNVLLTPGLGASSAPGQTRVTRGDFCIEDGAANCKQRAITAAAITTASTSPSAVVWSYALPTNTMATVTVSASGDNGTTNDNTVYKACFRRGAGSASTSHAATDAGLAAFKNGHAIQIALNSNTIEAKLVPGAATSTKWVVTVGVEERSIA